jgi:hypothetical protein
MTESDWGGLKKAGTEKCVRKIVKRNPEFNGFAAKIEKVWCEFVFLCVLCVSPVKMRLSTF